MLNVTEKALAYLAEILNEAGVDSAAGLRLLRHNGEWDVVRDDPRPTDIVFDHAGRTVLVIEQAAAQSLGDTTLDIEQGENGAELVPR